VWPGFSSLHLIIIFKKLKGKGLNPSSPQSSPPSRRGGSPFSPLGSTHSVTGWDEGINTYAKLCFLKYPCGARKLRNNITASSLTLLAKTDYAKVFSLKE